MKTTLIQVRSKIIVLCRSLDWNLIMAIIMFGCICLLAATVLRLLNAPPTLIVDKSAIELSPVDILENHMRMKIHDQQVSSQAVVIEWSELIKIDSLTRMKLLLEGDTTLIYNPDADVWCGSSDGTHHYHIQGLKPGNIATVNGEQYWDLLRGNQIILNREHASQYTTPGYAQINESTWIFGVP